MAAWAPVDHVLAAIDQTLFEEADKDLANRIGESRVESETFAGPIATGAELDHLFLNRVAVLFLKFPDALFELFAAEIAAIDTLFRQFALHHHLRGNTGVIRPWEPECVVAEHAVPANGHIDFGVFEHVSDVQRPGHIGRRNDEREYTVSSARVSAKDAGIDPPLCPMRLEPPGLVHFFNWHGENTNIARHA